MSNVQSSTDLKTRGTLGAHRGTVKYLVLILIAFTLSGENKHEKDLTLQISQLTEQIRFTQDALAKEKAVSFDNSSKLFKLTGQLKDQASHIEALVVERDNLKAQLVSQLKVNEFQARVIQATRDALAFRRTPKIVVAPVQTDPALKNAIDKNSTLIEDKLDRNNDTSKRVLDHTKKAETNTEVSMNHSEKAEEWGRRNFLTQVIWGGMVLVIFVEMVCRNIVNLKVLGKLSIMSLTQLRQNDNLETIRRHIEGMPEGDPKSVL